MRLPVVDHGHKLADRLRLAMMKLIVGEAPDVVKTLRYRPELAGQPLSDLTHEVMRGPSPWTVGEREMMAAYVSHLNQCLF